MSTLTLIGIALGLAMDANHLPVAIGAAKNLGIVLEDLNPTATAGEANSTSTSTF